MTKFKEINLTDCDKDITKFIKAIDAESEEDAKLIFEWAQLLTFEYALLQNVMSGHMTIGWKDGQAAFQMTRQGKEYVENDFLKIKWPNVIGDKSEV